jgi:hypothetical protein
MKNRSDAHPTMKAPKITTNKENYLDVSFLSGLSKQPSTMTAAAEPRN